MTRKFIIVLAITTLFTALVVGFSWFYLSQLLRQRLLWADETAFQLTASWSTPLPKRARSDQYAGGHQQSQGAARRHHYFAANRSNLNELLESVVGNSPIIYDAPSLI